MELLLIVIALVALSIFDRPNAARAHRSRRNASEPTPKGTPAVSEQAVEGTDQQQPIVLKSVYWLAGAASGM